MATADGIPTPALAPRPAAADAGPLPAWRETLVEGLAAGGFLVAAVLTVIALTGAVDLTVAAGLAVICALLSRVEFEVGDGGFTRPLQLVLIPMLLLTDPSIVPLLVAAAVLLAKIPDLVSGGVSARRIVFGIADCWFAIPPALVLSLCAWPAAVPLQALLVAAAVLSQFAGDFAASSLRMRFGLGIDPRSHLRVMGWIYLVDGLLTPVGLLAAAAGRLDVAAV